MKGGPVIRGPKEHYDRWFGDNTGPVGPGPKENLPGKIYVPWPRWLGARTDVDNWFDDYFGKRPFGTKRLPTEPTEPPRVPKTELGYDVPRMSYAPLVREKSVPELLKLYNADIA